MNGAGGEETRFSELQLGIRELFRIVVPGAYLAALFYFLAPGSDIVALMNKGTALLVVTVFFLGLFAYALRPHERWWPYFRGFELERDRLNRAIIESVGGDPNIDYVGPYKYFLETEAIYLKDRVHYFSSFYYMLTALSLFSASSAMALVLTQLSSNHLFRFRSLQTAPPGTFTASVLVLAAGFTQLYTLRGLWSIRLRETESAEKEAQVRQRRERRVAVAPIGLLMLALTSLIASQIGGGQTSLLISALADYRMWLLFILAVVFERLGLKQWTAIIGEQVTLVRDRAEAIRRIAGNTRV
jgi:hypothetical protein